MTSVERAGDRELVITRTFNAPPSVVFKAWSQPELFRRWWVPKSAPGIVLVGCDMDVRTGGKYRLEFGSGGPDTMAFYGKYLDVVPNERIVWTNDEEDEGAITTVTFKDLGGSTLVTFHEAYPSIEAANRIDLGPVSRRPSLDARAGQQVLKLRQLLRQSGRGAR